MPKKPKQKLNVLRVSMYLTKEQKKKLDELHEKTGAPQAELVRRALEAYFKEHL
jgi:predicted DNA-binding protein